MSEQHHQANICREWREKSFEWKLLNSSDINIDNETKSTLLEEISTGSDGTRALYAQFAAHLLPSRPDHRPTLLSLIQSASGGMTDQVLARRAKDAIFSGKWIQEAYLSATDDSCRNGEPTCSSLCESV